MKRIDPIVAGVIRDNMPEATIIAEEAPVQNVSSGIRRSVKAEAMIAKWSTPSFFRSFAAPDSAPNRAQQHDIDVAVVEIAEKGSSGRKRRQTVVVDKTSKQIIAVSG